MIARTLYLEEAEIKQEMNKIGVDVTGIDIMHKKARFRLIRIEDVGIREAMILKQELLAAGGDCAVSKNTLTGTAEKTAAIIMGTEKQIMYVVKKLKAQPFKCKDVAALVEHVMSAEKKTWEITLENYTLRLDGDTKIMGILNMSPDSFSGDGITDHAAAIERAKNMVKEGAEIIDVGGESTRPYSMPISEEEEIQRVVPVIEELAAEISVPISVDTYKPRVAELAIDAGATIINDIYGLRNAAMARLAAEHDTAVIIMHMKGQPRNMQRNPSYEDVITEIYSFLWSQVRHAISSGVEENKIIIDPGIGFGKTLAHNLEILKRLKEFKSMGRPLLIGPSRKSFIGQILALPPEQRLEGTLASISVAAMNGADIVRVHDVKEAKRALAVVNAIKKGQ